MSKEPDYNNDFITACRANLSNVLTLLEAKDPGLAKKIQTFSSRFNFPVADIEQKIRDDEVFRAIFAKDPGKQKIHENIAARFIKEIEGVEDFEQLGHDALVVFQGAVSSRKEARERGAAATAKTIDFRWTYNGKQVYASHKYTKESGGMQDSQYKDLQEFTDEANKSNLKDTYFLALADGPYYSLSDRGAGTTKLMRLKNMANRINVFALTTGELEEWLKEHCN